MSRSPNAPSTGALLNSLANDRRRRILGHLYQSDHGIHIEDLARALAAEAVESSDSTSDGSEQRVPLELYHEDLPELDAAGLIEHTDQRVTIAREDVFDHPGVRPFIQDPDQVTDDEVAVLSTLADARRRTAYSALADCGDTLERSDLARRIADREDEDVSVGDVTLSLHHVHLPALEEAGIADYDPDAGTATAREQSVLDDALLDGVERPQTIAPRA